MITTSGYHVTYVCTRVCYVLLCTLRGRGEQGAGVRGGEGVTLYDDRSISIMTFTHPRDDTKQRMSEIKFHYHGWAPAEMFVGGGASPKKAPHFEKKIRKRSLYGEKVAKRPPIIPIERKISFSTEGDRLLLLSPLRAPIITIV